MLVSDFTYNLPDSAIAKYPPAVRGTTKLLVLTRNQLETQNLNSTKTSNNSNNSSNPNLIDTHYAALPDHLRPGDLLVLNDTKVMRARLFTALPDGRPRELIILEIPAPDPANPGSAPETASHTSSTSPESTYSAAPESATVLYRGKLHPGDLLRVLDATTKQPTDFYLKVTQILGGGTAQISLESPTQTQRTLPALLAAHGTVPLPPYLHRDAEPADLERYQTVWAKHLGSAAAPTASLNLTPAILAALHQKGVQVAYLTLHVGLGTFLPIRTDRVEDHHMHSEHFEIPARTLAAIQKTKSTGGRVVAVGTTVARTLEFWAQTGQTAGADDIFIYPSFQFRVVDCLLTNFHAPRSTVLMLAAAFAGWKFGNSTSESHSVPSPNSAQNSAEPGWEELKYAYAHALSHDYKFLSYGDSMLIC